MRVETQNSEFQGGADMRDLHWIEEVPFEIVTKEVSKES